MLKPTIIIAIYQLGSGGVSAAVRSQMRQFVDAGHEVVLATLNHEPRFLERFAKLQKDDLIPSEASARNIYIDSAGESGVASEIHYLAKSYDQYIVQSRVQGFRRSSRESGKNTIETYFTAMGEIDSIHTRNQSGILVKVEHMESGVIHTESFKEGVRYHKESQRIAESFPYVEHFYALDGHCFFTRTINTQTGHGTAVHVFPRDSEEVRSFKGMPGWQIDWMQALVDEHQAEGSVPIVLAQAPSVIPKVAKLRRDSCIRIGMLHNNHNAAPFVPGSPLRSDHKEIFENMNQLDSLVVLTDTQKQDILQHHDAEANLCVIPNVVLPRESLQVERRANRVGVVAILDPRKQLDHVLRAFAQVLVSQPLAELVIWGRGKDEGHLKSVVRELNLGDRVSFEGYVTSVDAAYQSCSFTVLTSKSEGFPYSIAESSLNETPVIAYDCSFGPADMIRDGQSGFVLRRDDIGALADKMTFLLSEPEESRVLGANARKYIEQVTSPDIVYSKWEQLFASAFSLFSTRYLSKDH